MDIVSLGRSEDARGTKHSQNEWNSERDIEIIFSSEQVELYY